MVTKALTKHPYGERVSLASQFEHTNHMKSWQGRHGNSGIQGLTRVRCSAHFSFLFSLEQQPMGWCHTHSENLTTLVKPLWECPHKHTVLYIFYCYNKTLAKSSWMDENVYLTYSCTPQLITAGTWGRWQIRAHEETLLPICLGLVHFAFHTPRPGWHSSQWMDPCSSGLTGLLTDLSYGGKASIEFPSS